MAVVVVVVEFVVVVVVVLVISVTARTASTTSCVPCRTTAWGVAQGLSGTHWGMALKGLMSLVMCEDALYP